MKKINFLSASVAIVLMLTVGSCTKNQEKNISPSVAHPDKVTKEMMSENGTNPDEASITGSASLNSKNSSGENSRGNHYLYTESNAADKNGILVYEIKNNGALHLEATVGSGGAGTGSPLGSQGALVLDKNHQWLFAVNAGSNSVSSFEVQKDGNLRLAFTASTQGETPVSVSVHGNMLYVLNRGTDNIHGFWIGSDGRLTHIEGSTQALSGTGVDAPQISFTPDGNWVVVTEKATNIIGTFKIKNNGSAEPGNFSPSVGNTPFGFDFARNRYLIVSNAEGGATGAGTATSYATQNGNIRDINGAKPNYQGAPCWVAITKYGSFAYITNTVTNNISSYYIAPWGGLYLVEGNAAETGMGPLDIVVAANNNFVYTLNTGSNSITGYYRKVFGQLAPLGSASGLPAPATGLATF